MYRITLRCVGLPADEGPQAAREIDAAFQTRTQHVDAYCRWDGKHLFLTAWNDFDETGMALRDEFSDAISDYVRTPFQGDIELMELLYMR